MKACCLLLLASLVFLASCAHNRPPPELVEKTFSPVRGGVVEHKQPQDGIEQKKYMAASVSLMKKFCHGGFKVLSESKFSKDLGTSTTVAVTHSVAMSGSDSDDMIRIKFTCNEKEETSLDEELGR